MNLFSSYLGLLKKLPGTLPDDPFENGCEILARRKPESIGDSDHTFLFPHKLILGFLNPSDQSEME
tara:strand:+ start:373 stop:570 length:198 start_codon:yes stop_codon:yes gene_type:complete